MELTWALRKLLDSYVRDEISLDALQDELDRLAPALASMAAESYAARVADHVEITLAEMARGHRSEDELKQIMNLLLWTNPTFELPVGPDARGASGARTLTAA